MAPALSEIKLTDIDFDTVKACNDKRVVKQYIKLLEADGNFFIDLANCCKNKLLELDPKEYYLLYPRQATHDEIQDAMNDIIEWEVSVKETDAALRKSRLSQKQHEIWEEESKIHVPIRGHEPAVARKNVTNSVEHPRKLQNGSKARTDDVYARDTSKMKEYYNAWDNFNVEAAEAEIDEEELKQEESRRQHFCEMRDKQEIANTSTAVEVDNLPRTVPEAHRKHLADSEKEKGNEAFYAKDFEEAEAYYSRGLHFAPDDPASWANRALVRLKLQKPELALADCEQALSLNPRYMKALHRKGKAFHELRRYEEAVNNFQMALQESPGNTQINGDLMASRRKLRSEVSNDQFVNAPSLATATTRSSCRIEEMSDDDAEGRLSPPPGYMRVMIEEESDSSDEERIAEPAHVESAGVRAKSVFHKVAIEEVSCSEEEEDEIIPAQFSPPLRTSTEITCVANPIIRNADTKGQNVPVVFEDMD